MTQYAQYDPTISINSPVIGWYDIAAISYPSLPDTGMLVVSGSQWAARITGLWAVTAGALVAYTAQAMGLPQQAVVALATRVAAGIALTSTGTPALNATYALDSVSTGQIFQIGLYANQFGVFPSGDATQPYPDAGGTSHSFTVTAFIAFLKVVAPLVSALTTQAGVMAQGGSPVWPSQSATIG